MLTATRSLIRKLRRQPRAGWIGVDIGSHSIKLAQVERVEGRMSLSAKHVIPLPATATLTPESLQLGWLPRVIRDALSATRDFRGRRVAAVLSMSVADFRSVSLPLASAKETREMVLQELTDSGLGSADTLEFDCWGRLAQSVESDAAATVNVLSVSRRLATQISEGLESAGLMCRVLDGSPFALARAIELVSDHSASGVPVGVLDWGHQTAQFTVVVNGEPAFTRVLKDCGVQRIMQAIQTGLELTADESRELLSTHGLPGRGPGVIDITEVQELAGEITAEPIARFSAELEKTWAYLANQRSELLPTEIWLTGGAAGIRNIEAGLKSRTGIAVRPWALSAVRTALGGDSEPSAVFAQAAALSQLGLES